jgi:hypothetical protein
VTLSPPVSGHVHLWNDCENISFAINPSRLRLFDPDTKRRLPESSSFTGRYPKMRCTTALIWLGYDKNDFDVLTPVLVLLLSHLLFLSFLLTERVGSGGPQRGTRG